jgi:hypothetical protein
VRESRNGASLRLSMGIESHNSKDTTAVGPRYKATFSHGQSGVGCRLGGSATAAFKCPGTGPKSVPDSLAIEFWFRLPSTRGCGPFAHSASRLNVRAE